MHNTHFFFTSVSDPEKAITHVRCYLEEKDDIDGADYFSVEGAINLETGQSAEGDRELDPKFYTTTGVLTFFRDTFLEPNHVREKLKIYRQQIQDGLDKEEYWHCSYAGKVAGIQFEKLQLSKEPITLERMITDKAFECGPYNFTEVGITRLEYTDKLPTLVLVDFHS
jgi:hypothetical protein